MYDEDNCPVLHSVKARKTQYDAAVATATVTVATQVGDPSRGAIPVCLGGKITTTVDGCTLDFISGSDLVHRVPFVLGECDVPPLSPEFLPQAKSILWPLPTGTLSLVVNIPAGTPDVTTDVMLGLS